MTDRAEPIELIVDDVRLGDATTRVTRVTTTSSEDAASFVLVPGVGVASTYFEFLAPTLAERGDVYALDLPGFAGVPRSAEQPTARFFADHVEAVLDHYELTNPVIIGHSMGTQVVTELLLRRPEITHAVLVSPVINEDESGLFPQAVRFAQSTTRESVHLALTAFAAYLLCGMVYFLTVLPYMLRYRLSDRIRGVQAKVLLIRGEFDTSSPRRFHSRLVSAAPDAWRWEIEGASHSVINGHAIGVAKLTSRHVDGSLARKGRMSAEEAVLPPARHNDLALVLQAMGSRVAEWVSAARRDESGVERAKAQHARILWRAYAPGRRRD